MRRKNSFWILPLAVFSIIFITALSCEEDEDDSDETIEDGTTGTVTDIDGNEYKTVYINGKEWMAEDLRTTKYNDGTEIPTGLSDDDWSSSEQGAYTIYPSDLEEADGIDSDSAMIDAYGLLYNWHAVDSEKGLAPEGWRIPTEEDWAELEEYLENNYEDINNDNVGAALRSCRQVNSPLGGDCATTEHPRWNEDEDNHGTDEFGFSALPAGNRADHGKFVNLGHMWTAWAATHNDEDAKIIRLRENYDGCLNGDTEDKNNGYSVRCVKD
ncbi:MAG: fibrobacter succinogenes major paralogous domain-containing protein [Bacteroidota bacterium]